jgi:hypothetical protein
MNDRQREALEAERKLRAEAIATIDERAKTEGGVFALLSDMLKNAEVASAAEPMVIACMFEGPSFVPGTEHRACSYCGRSCNVSPSSVLLLESSDVARVSCPDCISGALERFKGLAKGGA